jgi:RNA polymerase sigma factor (TIGR02999 family)
MGVELRDDGVLTTMRRERREALDLLVAGVYRELRAVAHRQLRARHRGAGGTPTLGTTALVNEAYLKLVDQSRATWRDRAHFLSLAAVAMRHILVDRARARSSGKRGGTRLRITWDEDAIALDDQSDVMLEIDEALTVLETLNPRLCQVVTLRFFGGISEEEVAKMLELTVRTVQRDWAKARMLLLRILES